MTARIKIETKNKRWNWANQKLTEGQHTQQSWGIDTQKLSQDKTIDEKAVLENNLFQVRLRNTC